MVMLETSGIQGLESSGATVTTDHSAPVEQPKLLESTASLDRLARDRQRFAGFARMQQAIQSEVLEQPVGSFDKKADEDLQQVAGKVVNPLEETHGEHLRGDIRQAVVGMLQRERDFGQWWEGENGRNAKDNLLPRAFANASRSSDMSEERIQEASSTIAIERVHGGIIVSNIPTDLFVELAIKSIKTKDGNVSDKAKIQEMVTRNPEIALTVPIESVLGDIIPAEIRGTKVVLMKEGPDRAIERAIAHEKEEIFGLAVDQALTSRTFRLHERTQRLSERIPGLTEPAIQIALHDIAARLREGNTNITLQDLDIRPTDIDQFPQAVSVIKALTHAISEKLTEIETDHPDELSSQLQELATMVQGGMLQPVRLLKVLVGQEDITPLLSEVTPEDVYGEKGDGSILVSAIEGGRFAHAEQLRNTGDIITLGGRVLKVIGTPLGSGTYSTAYKVIEGKMDKGAFLAANPPKTFVLKETVLDQSEIDAIQRGSQAISDDLQAFYHEQRVLEHLRDVPGTPRIYGKGRQEVSNGRGKFWAEYTLMEFAPGDDLEKMTTARVWNLDNVIDLISSSLDILQAAHRRGIIHKDIKPLNMRVEFQRDSRLNPIGVKRVIILDWGTPKDAGTPPYAAPELYKHTSSVQTDIYELGVVMYELLSRKSVTGKIQESDIENLQDVPDDVKRILRKALAEKESDRFASAEAMREQLKHIDFQNYNVRNLEYKVPRSLRIQQPDQIPGELQNYLSEVESIARVDTVEAAFDQLEHFAKDHEQDPFVGLIAAKTMRQILEARLEQGGYTLSERRLAWCRRWLRMLNKAGTGANAGLAVLPHPAMKDEVDNFYKMVTKIGESSHRDELINTLSLIQGVVRDSRYRENRYIEDEMFLRVTPRALDFVNRLQREGENISEDMLNGLENCLAGYDPFWIDWKSISQASSLPANAQIYIQPVLSYLNILGRIATVEPSRKQEVKQRLGRFITSAQGNNKTIDSISLQLAQGLLTNLR